MGGGDRIITFKSLSQLLATALVASVFAAVEPAFADSSSAPKQLGQAASDSDGRLTLTFDCPSGSPGGTCRT